MQDFLEGINQQNAINQLGAAFEQKLISISPDSLVKILEKKVGQAIFCGFDTESLQESDLNEVGIVAFEGKEILFCLNISMTGFGHFWEEKNPFGDLPGKVSTLTEKDKKRAQNKDWSLETKRAKRIAELENFWGKNGAALESIQQRQVSNEEAAKTLAALHWLLEQHKAKLVAWGQPFAYDYWMLKLFCERMNIPCLFGSGLNQNGLDIGSFCCGVFGKQIRFSDVKMRFEKHLREKGEVPDFGVRHTALADAWLQYRTLWEVQQFSKRKEEIWTAICQGKDVGDEPKILDQEIKNFLA